MWQHPPLWGGLRPPPKQWGTAFGGPPLFWIPWWWMLPHVGPYILSCMAPELNGCARTFLKWSSIRLLGVSCGTDTDAGAAGGGDSGGTVYANAMGVGEVTGPALTVTGLADLLAGTLSTVPTGVGSSGTPVGDGSKDSDGQG